MYEAMHEAIATGVYAPIVGIIDLMDCPKEQQSNHVDEVEFDELRLIDTQMKKKTSLNPNTSRRTISIVCFVHPFKIRHH